MLTSDIPLVMKVIWYQIPPQHAGRVADPLWPHPCRDGGIYIHTYIHTYVEMALIVGFRNVCFTSDALPDV